MSNFRIWWQKPREFGKQIDERKVSFLELFYDLVYVVIIAQLSHKLAEDISLIAVGKFAFLFLTIWCAWLNGATYHDIHGNDDIKTRVLTFLQMFTVAAMAVFAHDAFGHTSVGFAVSCAAFLAIITALWWRSGYHDPDHRPLSTPYSLAFLIATVLSFTSIFVDETYRYYLWAVALAIIALSPMVLFLASTKNEKMAEQFNRAETISESLAERYGLMTIIVLGEVIVGVVSGTAKHEHLTLGIGVTAILSMLLAIGVWWLYFDFIARHMPKKETVAETSWIYLHLPLMMGITAIGATVLNVVKHPEILGSNTKTLLIGSVVAVYFSISMLFYTIKMPENFVGINKKGQRVTFVAAIISLLLLFVPLDVIPLLVILNLVMLTPVYFGVRVWIKMRSAGLIEE